MQLSVFSTDSVKSGFRLQYMEVLNWGTFDEQIYRISPGGETSLLTGANGSGKTTFVDALLTLIVPEKRHRFYNQSSGSEKKGDRTEESYVMGGFGTINSESGVTKTLYLRENKETAYSILLVNFANEAMQEVTLFQVRYFTKGEMKKVFGIAHKSLHIETDFKPFDLGNIWRKRLDQQYNKGSRKHVEWFDAASRYANRMVSVLGMQSIQALTLFNQTVGIKVLGNLDDFIRKHMLEPKDMESQFQELKQHLTTLLDAQRNIEKAEEQIRLLRPIEEHFGAFKELQVKQQDLEQTIQTAVLWKSFTHDLLLQQALESGQTDLRELDNRSLEIKEQVQTLREEERIIRNQIDQNKAGQRLQQLEQELHELQAREKETARNQEQFTEWCTVLNFKETSVSDEPGYKRIRKEAERTGDQLRQEDQTNRDEDFNAKNRQREALTEKESIEVELNVLLHSKSNIPAQLVRLRRELCDNLKLDTTELPFAGELMQVKAEERGWLPALEKLLYGFSLRLLVPDRHYKRVTRYINQTNLGTRLIYHHVTDPIAVLAEDQTVFYKLDFHPDHALSEWVQQQIVQQYSYICLDDEKSIERYDKAITLNALIKNRSRHEKDDRPGMRDASRYVMGWNNEQKKELLMGRRHSLVGELDDINERIERCRTRSERLKGKYLALSRIQEHEGYLVLDVAGVQRQMHQTEGQIKELRESNKQLQALRTQLDEKMEQLAATELLRETCTGEKTLLQNRIDTMEGQRMALQNLLEHITANDKDALLVFQQQHAGTIGGVGLETMEETYRQFKEQLEKQAQTIQQRLYREENVLNRCIGQIKNPPPAILQRFPDWYSDVQFLPDEAIYADDFKEWLDKLNTENLPRYRRDFENFINDTITYKIGGLNEEMEKWEREINYSVDKLNSSLSGINFNRLPDTYIQLGKRAVADATIKAFRTALLDALPQAANWQQSAFEEKALHFRQKVQPLIDSLDESEMYRARVMDVRNWFEFWADEKYRNTNELKKTYRQMGQLSGGEKAQLTYTILCSAIAYQFGITREGNNSRSLRFIAVDESFSNQDEDKATYLMELCKQLHLQLLVVTPSDKIQIVQDFIAHVHLVQRVNNRHSIMYNMTIKELQSDIRKHAITVTSETAGSATL
ncbi:ATP-binding protein [Niabella terrae]